MEKVPISLITVIDDDFWRAAEYYQSTMFGGTKEAHFAELKKQYEEHENLHSLVWLFARQRVEYTNSMSNPRYVCENRIVQELLTWFMLPGKSTPKRLYAHMELEGIAIPEWLLEALHSQDVNEEPPKKLMTELLYHAIATSVIETKS